MRISDVLKGKGDSSVATIRPDDDVSALLALLASRGIGAVVVSDDGATIAGIVSERDIVRRLADRPDSLHAAVRDIMTVEVITCTPETTVEELSGEMTQRRIRHIPVVRGGQMIGLVSIGDVVKHRIGQLQAEAEHLAGYLHQ
ncbi:MAG: CBS domain-containing protein [Austwickia sp.]|jgi:CBS domain-containing protein|nr:MAG: CBS domain-containing protein [Austwickia sp.]